MTQGTLLALYVVAGSLIFIAGVFVGVGWGYTIGYRNGERDEAESADPTTFWAKQQEEVALANGKVHTLDEDLAEWREQVALAERLRRGARG
jgi:hypothetical protein